MKAARIHRFGPPGMIVIDDVPPPAPGPGQVLVRVAGAGVGPWDALIRENRSKVNSPLPITLGSDFSGVVEARGAGVAGFQTGDEIYGATNPEFVGACAEFALADSTMIARKPRSLRFAEAASAPVVAVTAWQMLHDYAKATRGRSVLIHGAGGNVGAYAVQLARRAGLEIFATASAEDAPYVRSLGAGTVIDYRSQRFEDAAPMVDIVLDMLGGAIQDRSLRRIRPGGILVSVVSKPAPQPEGTGDIRTVFFLVEVTTERLDILAGMFDRGELAARVGTVLPLEEARTAHEMLAGAPHQPGKIVLRVANRA